MLIWLFEIEKLSNVGIGKWKILVAPPRVELGHTEPESAVLPLHNGAILSKCKDIFFLFVNNVETFYLFIAYFTRSSFLFFGFFFGYFLYLFGAICKSFAFVCLVIADGLLARADIHVSGRLGGRAC